MKRLVEYKLHGGAVPYFIEDGGYWIDPAFPHKLIGVTKDDSCCYVPIISLIEFTPAELTSKVVAYTMYAEDRVTLLTDAEKTTMITNWLTDRGF
jgi:hypothetical protein